MRLSGKSRGTECWRSGPPLNQGLANSGPSAKSSDGPCKILLEHRQVRELTLFQGCFLGAKAELAGCDSGIHSQTFCRDLMPETNQLSFPRGSRALPDTPLSPSP